MKNSRPDGRSEGTPWLNKLLEEKIGLRGLHLLMFGWWRPLLEVTPLLEHNLEERPTGLSPCM